ncbi:MAG: hypothetical protein ACYDA4_04155 [Ignavibacteriaceae bacterium]
MIYKFNYAGRDVVITDGQQEITIGTPDSIIITVPRKDIYEQTKAQLFIVNEIILREHLKFLNEILPSKNEQESNEIHSMIRAITELIQERNE